MKIGFIVEGFNDERLLLKIFPESRIAVTKGTRFDRRVRIDIQKVVNNSDITYILTDPDEPGDLLASRIQNEFQLNRIHIDPDEAICYRNGRKKIGVEHCDPDYLKSVVNLTVDKHRCNIN